MLQRQTVPGWRHGVERLAICHHGFRRKLTVLTCVASPHACPEFYGPRAPGSHPDAWDPDPAFLVFSELNSAREGTAAARKHLVVVLPAGKHGIDTNRGLCPSYSQKHH
jgi:hypothetical protein